MIFARFILTIFLNLNIFSNNRVNGRAVSSMQILGMISSETLLEPFHQSNCSELLKYKLISECIICSMGYGHLFNINSSHPYK